MLKSGSPGILGCHFVLRFTLFTAGMSSRFKFWYDSTMLSFESQHVIGLRLIKLAGGGKNAQTEANRMVTEKFSASMAAVVTLMCGGSGETVLAEVRKKVRSNSRRLSR